MADATRWGCRKVEGFIDANERHLVADLERQETEPDLRLRLAPLAEAVRREGCGTVSHAIRQANAGNPDPVERLFGKFGRKDTALGGRAGG